MGIFGWSYPAGCSGPPDDEQLYCDICYGSVIGVTAVKCICPECDVCGEVGNPDCYASKGKVNHGLEMSIAVKEHREKALKLEEEYVKAEKAYFEALAAENAYYEGLADEYAYYDAVTE